MKLEEAEIAEIKKKAELNGLTVTDLLMKGLRDVDRQFFLEQQIKDLRDQVAQLEQKIRFKIKTTEYVSIPVTRPEKNLIRQRAHEANQSQGRYLRQYLAGANVPELPFNG